MIGIIPAAGKGTRLGELGKKIPKSLVKINGVTLLEKTINSLKKTNISKIIIIVGYKKDKIVDFLNSKDFGIKIQTIEQKEQRGLAHAILQTEKFVNEPFIIHLPDNIIEDYSYIIKEFNKENSNFIQLYRNRDDPNDPIPTLIIKNNFITDIVPGYNGKDGYRGVPIYIMNPIFFKYCKEAMLNLPPGKELRETDVMLSLIKDGIKIKGIKYKGKIKSITTKKDI